jgi:DNA-binding IclR family transcriptional regulator
MNTSAGMSIEAADEPASGRVQSVARAAQLLRAIAAAPEPATAPELADRCGLNRSTAWRLLATLEQQRLVERDAGNRYSVGHAVVQLAGAAGHGPFVRIAHPHLRRLAKRSGETVSLAIPRQLELVYVDQVQAPHVMAADWQGRSTPLHATSTGKAFLAWLSERELDAALREPLERYTDSTVVQPAELRAELAKVRGRGYAVSRGELEAELWGVSAPVLDAAARPLAVVSVWGAAARIGKRGLAGLGRQVASAAGDIASALSR